MNKMTLAQVVQLQAPKIDQEISKGDLFMIEHIMIEKSQPSLKYKLNRTCQHHLVDQQEET